LFTVLEGVPGAYDTPLESNLESIRLATDKNIHVPTMIAFAVLQYRQFPWGTASGILQVRYRATLFRSPGHPALSLLPGTW
jgi:hypothetical protein